MVLTEESLECLQNGIDRWSVYGILLTGKVCSIYGMLLTGESV